MANRRNFLKKTSLFTLGGLMAGKTGLSFASNAVGAPQANKAKQNMGLQIYSLGKELYVDLPAGLKKIKDMGYDTIELAGYNNGKIGGVEMMEFKQIANDAGLMISSSHVNPPVREYTPENLASIKDFWKKTADDHAQLGVTYLIQPGQPSTRNLEETKFVCDVFNEAGQISKAVGIPFGYHNHEYEFAKVTPGGTEALFGRRNKGETIYDVFMENTDPNNVFYEMDVYWTVMGQNDPVEYLKKYPDRIKVLHIKDRSVLGQSGMMNFEQIFNQFNKNGYSDYFVELERMPNGTQYEGVAGCADYLQKSNFVK